MRRANARPSKVQSQSIDLFRIPESVRALLDTRVDDRRAAGRLGAEAAIAFVEALQDEPFLVGVGLLPRIFQHLESHCSDGIAQGFAGQLDRILLRGARADAASARMFLGAIAPVSREAHDGPRAGN